MRIKLKSEEYTHQQYYHEPTVRQTKVTCCLLSVHFVSLYNLTSFFSFIAYANYIENKLKCLGPFLNKFTTTEQHNETHTFHDIHTVTRKCKKKTQKIQKHKLKKYTVLLICSNFYTLNFKSCKAASIVFLNLRTS